MKYSGWAVAAALLILDQEANFLRDLAGRVLETGLTDIGKRNKSPESSSSQTLRTQLVRSSEIKFVISDNYVRLSDPESAKRHPKVAQILAILKRKATESPSDSDRTVGLKISNDSNSWSHEERLAAFYLYCQVPFGRLDQRNPDVISLSKGINRPPSVVAKKACDFASLDESIPQRDLEGVSKADRELWGKFLENPSEIADRAQIAYATALLKSDDPTKAKDTSGESVLHLEYDDFFPDASKSEPILRDAPSGPSETVRIQKSRRLQSFFRDCVLISYEHRCAITGLEIPVLLVAGHIIPWSVDETRRADPRNGICLNVLHDKMFDRGLITFDKDWRLVVSPVLRKVEHPSFHKQALLDFEGARLVLPTRFQPDPEAMRYHRENIFNIRQSELTTNPHC